MCEDKKAQNQTPAEANVWRQLGYHLAPLSEADSTSATTSEPKATMQHIEAEYQELMALRKTLQGAYTTLTNSQENSC